MGGASEESNTNALSRRNAIKAAAAVGVGAVAWTGPKVGVFGASPAYAAVCSGANTPAGESNSITASGTPSASSSVCNNDDEDDDDRYFSLVNLSTALPGSITVDGIARTVTVGTSSPCTSNSGSSNRISWAGGLVCRLTVTISSGNLSFTASSGPASSPLQVPLITRGSPPGTGGSNRLSSSNSTYNVTLACRSDSGCAI